MMFFMRGNMQGRKTTGNLSSAAAEIRSQLWGHEASQEVYAQELSADILDVASEQNITIDSPLLPITPSHVIAQPQAFIYEPSTSHSGVQSPSESWHSRSRSQTPTGPPIKRSKTLSAQEELVNIEKEKMEWLKKMRENDDDADKQFLLSLLPQMKSLAPNKLSAVKIKILSVLHEASYSEETQYTN